MTEPTQATQIPGLRYGEFQGFPALLIKTPFSRAAISLFGGQVLSFVPMGFDDVFWLSPTAKRPPDPIRGGVPVCWPYFARQGQPADAPMHGFARTGQWQLTHAQQNPDGTVVLALAAPELADVPMSLMLTLSIGKDFGQALTTVNLSKETVRFTQALHTYFAVGDVNQISVTGLDDLSYSDKFNDFKMHTQRGDWNLQDPRDPGRSDRIYVDTGSHFELLDTALKRKVTLETVGSKALVVWNPGAEHVKSFDDIPLDAWTRYVCLEAANCGPDVIELAPEGSHRLQQTIHVSALEKH